MTTRSLAVLALLIATLSLVLFPATLPDQTYSRALDTINAVGLRSTLEFLASDAFKGRDTNTPSNEIASRYLAHRFEMSGLEPAGDAATFFQNFTLLQGELGENNRLEIRNPAGQSPTVAALREDFFPSLLSPAGKIQSGVTFAGYGISAPELEYDDYEGLDVRGRIVVVMSGHPRRREVDSPFRGQLTSDYGVERHKILNAQGRGAAGIVIVPDELNGPGPSRMTWLANSIWPEDPSTGRYTLKIWSEEVRIPAVHTTSRISQAIFELSGLQLIELQREIDRDLRPAGQHLEDVILALETDTHHREVSIRNVLAFRSGSDPLLQRELVVVGAHFDHVGEQEGEIFNGADDNASGTAGLLEIAAAVSALQPAPKRSILFAAWNAEEKGLLGSYFYVSRPVFPISATRAMIQMDMIGRDEEIPDPADPRYRGMEQQSAEDNRNAVNVLGYSRSPEFRKLVTRVNEHVGLDVRFRYDDHPINLLRRSDSWPFLIAGVPALFFTTGLHPDYHSPSDTSEKINYEKLERIVRLVLLSVLEVANAEEPPRFQLLVE